MEILCGNFVPQLANWLKTFGQCPSSQKLSNQKEQPNIIDSSFIKLASTFYSEQKATWENKPDVPLCLHTAYLCILICHLLLLI